MRVLQLAPNPNQSLNRCAVLKRVANERHVSLIARVELNEFESGEAAAHFDAGRLSNARRTGDQSSAAAFSRFSILGRGGYVDQKEESEKVLLEWFESQCRSQLYRFRMEDWLPMISSSVRGAYFVVRRDSSIGRALGVRLGRAAGFAA